MDTRTRFSPIAFLPQYVLNLSNEHGGAHVELPAQLYDRPQRWATDSPFEQTDIRPVKAALESQFILRQLAFLP